MPQDLGAVLPALFLRKLLGSLFPNSCWVAWAASAAFTAIDTFIKARRYPGKLVAVGPKPRSNAFAKACTTTQEYFEANAW
jgi:hypothetical protein